MESRQYSKTANSKRPASPLVEGSNNITHIWPAAARPLSDIRELTEPSLLDAMTRTTFGESHRRIGVDRQSSMKRGPSLRRGGSVKIIEPSPDSGYNFEAEDSDESEESPGSIRDTSSNYSIPFTSIPPRASSQTREATKTFRSAGLRVSPNLAHAHNHTTVPNRGQSRSPVKQAGIRLDPVSFQSSRRIPSRTFFRTPQPKDILEYPTHRHPRIGLDVQIVAPLFVGGGSIEGCVRVVVDEADKIRQKKTITIGRLAVDLVGTEETSGNRKSIFLSLGTELLDPDHPPPRNMLDPENRHQGIDSFWTLMPSFSSIPFMISLPLDTGPPPFHSKHARIRFILCATLLIKDSGKQYLVRSSQDIAVLSTYDPEKALRSLPSPLTACDEFTCSKAGMVESTRVTAGLHRQVWVSGSTIFVDIHIANSSRRAIKKLDLSLERDILCYRHAAAATLEQSASQSRIFESNVRSILSKSCLKQGMHGWAGVEAYGSVTRTCDLDIPRGHATVKCGKYFEVRYFLNLCVSTSHTRLVSVQLPLILIHMNSLDVVPNSVAQVAAAIEEKRTYQRGRSRSASEPNARVQRRLRSQAQVSPSPAKQSSNLRHHPSKLQGRAFAAPRQQSLDRARAETAELQHLGAVIDLSPRKHGAGKSAYRVKQKTVDIGAESSHRGGRNVNMTIVSRPAREIHKQPSNLSLGGISVGSYTMFNDSSASGGGMEYVTPPSKRKGRVFDLSALSGLGDDENSRAGGTGGGDGPRSETRRVHSTRSADSFRSRNSSMTGKSRWRDHFALTRKENTPAAAAGPRETRSAVDQHKDTSAADTVGAYALGLARHMGGHKQARPMPMRPSIGRPSREGVVGVARAGSWRIKDDVNDDGNDDGGGNGNGNGYENQLDRSRFEFKAVKRKGSGRFREWLGGLKGGKQQQQDVVKGGNWI